MRKAAVLVCSAAAERQVAERKIYAHMPITDISEAGKLTSREEAVAFAYWLAEAVNAHDVAALVGRYADNAVLVSPVFRETVGRDAIAASWEAIFQMFPDW